MGSVKRDIYKTGRQYDEDYAYNEDGIASLLKDIYRLYERKWFKGDVDATTILTDLYMALDSDCLTPRMRQVVALYYFVQLTEEETAEILDVTQQMINKTLISAMGRLGNEMERGGSKQGGRGDVSYYGSTPLYRWLNGVAYNGHSPYYVPAKVITEVLERHVTDERAQELLKQRLAGPPVLIEEYPDGDEYRCLSEEQFKWRDRRMSFKPEIYPANTVTGSHKVAIKLRDGDKYGNEWIVEKRKIFRNNFN